MRTLLILLTFQSLYTLFFQLALLSISLVVDFHFLGFIFVKSALIRVGLCRQSLKIVTVILKFVN